MAADGTLDPAAVADRVFNDADALADLTAIVHPAVGKEIADRLAALDETDEVVVLDVPLLVESKNAYPVAGLLVVDSTPRWRCGAWSRNGGCGRRTSGPASPARQPRAAPGPGRPGHRQQRHPR